MLGSIPKVTRVASEDGDWEGLYINNRLVLEGHSLDWREVLSQFGVETETHFREQDWFEQHGFRCPPEISEEILGE